MRTRILVAIAGVSLGLTAAGPAQAASVKLAGGGTTLKLAPAAGKALKSLGVSVSPTGKAKASSKGITFPITGGKLDPATGAGTIRHTGGLRLKAGKTSVVLSDYTVVSAGPKKSSMSVKVGKARAKLLVPAVSKVKLTRDGLGIVLSRVDIHLTKAGASALNKTFDVKAFKGGFKLGTATVAATPSQIAFAGGQTDLVLDSGTAAALTSLGVTPGIVGSAKANPDGSLGFPITGGLLDAKTLAGSIPHSGGISLTAGATVVTLTDFTIDTTAKQLTAIVAGGARTAILDLDLSAIKVTTEGLAVTVANVPATLTAGAAAALNQAFGVTAFTAGLKFGVATVRGQSA